MMNYPKYESYKDSGIDWLGEIPSDWEIYPLNAQSKIKSIINNHDEELLSVYLDKGVIRFDDVEAKRTNVTSLDLSKYQLVEYGDFVLNNQQAWRGSVGVSKLKGIVSPAYIILELSKKFDTDYANYLFRDSSMVAHYLVSSRGVGTIQRNLYWPQFKNTPVFIPSIAEQTLIAKFLNQKTAQIDEAIRIKEKQIELLKEQKQIMIQNAVTKGLDPNVRMKDSGVDWIGEIPEHWEIKKLGSLLANYSVKNKASLPLLSITREKGIILRDTNDLESNHNFIPDDLSGYKMIKKDQFGMNKMKAWQGSYGISEYTGIVSPAYYIFDISLDLYPNFFHHAIRSKVYISFFGSASDGVRIGQWDLSRSRMSNIPFIIPTLGEQRRIVQHIIELDKEIFAFS